MRALQGHADFVLCVGFAPDGRWLASGGADNTVRLWDLLRGEEVPLPLEPRGWVASVAFSPNGRWLAVGEHPGRLNLIDVTSRRVEPLSSVPGTVSGLAFTPDSRALAWCDYRGGVHLAPLGGLPVQLIEEPREQFALAISPRGRYLAAAGRNGRIHVWSLPEARERLTIDLDDRDGCRCLAFDPRERILVAALGSGLTAWELPEGRPLWHVHHPAVVHAAAVSTDGRLIVTGAWDGRIRLFDWDHHDTRPPRPQRELDFGQKKVFDLALSPDGMIGACAGSLPDALLLWDMD
jgi:WD40 repeat protein